MKRLKQLIKGITIATAVYRVCVEAYKDAKAKADAAAEEAHGSPINRQVVEVVDECNGEPSLFDIVMVGGEVRFLEGDGDVLIMDDDGQVH